MSETVKIEPNFFISYTSIKSVVVLAVFTLATLKIHNVM